MKTAFGILGEGQLSLTKVLVLVDSRTDPSDIKSVARAVFPQLQGADRFPIVGTNGNRTRWTSLEMRFQHGSKMVVDATGYGHEPESVDGPQLRFDPTSLSSAVSKYRLILRQHTGHAGAEWLPGVSATR